jgi:hypothetical protein
MSLATTAQEARDWLGGLGHDTAFLNASYASVVRDLARTLPMFQAWTVIQGQAGVSLYTLPDTAVRLEAVIWYPRELWHTSSDALDTIRPGWGEEVGIPEMWYEDETAQNTFRVYPVPAVTGAVPPAFTDNALVIYQAVPVEAEVYGWLEGLVAMRVASREAWRLGEQQDAKLAQALDTISAGLLSHLMLSEMA